jgi:Tol biopolymer transport system component
MLRRLLVAASLAVAAACGHDPTNPFTGASATRPPSADAVLLFVSGSWSSAPGDPRELLSLNADGSKAERLTGCAEAATPCDFIQVAPSPDRNRLAAIRTTPAAAAGASALYFMDLSRSVEALIFPSRRVDSVDYSPDGSFIIYSAIVPQSTQEDLYYSQPNGTAEQNLTDSAAFRERSARIDPFARTAVYEGIDESGVSRIYLFSQTPLTSGPATGESLPGTPYVVGADADPVFSPDSLSVAFRRLTGVGNGGLGTWDVLSVPVAGTAAPQVVSSGPVFRGPPDWGSKGIVFVETDAAGARSQLVLVQPDGSGRTVLRTEDAGYRMGGPRWLPGS